MGYLPVKPLLCEWDVSSLLGLFKDNIYGYRSHSVVDSVCVGVQVSHSAKSEGVPPLMKGPKAIPLPVYMYVCVLQFLCVFFVGRIFHTVIHTVIHVISGQLLHRLFLMSTLLALLLKFCVAGQ